MKKFYLIGKNVASSKNSKRWTGKMLINSKQAMDYYDFVIPLLTEMKPDIMKELQTLNKPYHFHFQYIRDSKRHFDYLNVCQILADAFQKVDILEDDDMNNFIPVFEGFSIDKINPGVIFWID